MASTVSNWVPAPVGFVVIPSVIERRWCPIDEGHWKVDGDRCPVCESEIQVSRYVLETQKRPGD